MSDALRERLDHIAGVSLRAPQGEYVVSDLPFGEARLRRNAGTGRWEALTLRLTPSAAADVEKAGGSRASTVLFPLEHWLSHGAFSAAEVNAVAAGLHPLLVEGLLSQPGWLTSSASSHRGLTPPAATSLEALRSALSQTTRRFARCPACAERRSTLDPRSSEQTALLRMLGLVPGRARPMPSEPAPECPHAAMRQLAFQRIYKEHPELAFEAALLLVAHPTSDPPRFVLSPTAMKSMLEEWLTPDARDDYDDYDDYDDFSRAPRRVAVPRAVPGDKTLTPGQRGALAFATQCWEAGGALRDHLPPASDAPGEMPVMSTEVTPPDVALLWPEGVASPAPPPAPPAKATPKNRVKKPPRAGTL